MPDQTISISVELDRRPSNDQWGNYGREALFDDGWFTYGVVVYDHEDADEWFQRYVVWPRAHSSTPKGDSDATR